MRRRMMRCTRAVTIGTVVMSLPWWGHGGAPGEAHRSGCHHWHACPPDRGTYVCGDLGYCSQYPDNAYCQAGQPRAAAQRTPPAATPPPLTPLHHTAPGRRAPLRSSMATPPTRQKRFSLTRQKFREHRGKSWESWGQVVAPGSRVQIPSLTLRNRPVKRWAQWTG
jgi:hypothetical protein